MGLLGLPGSWNRVLPMPPAKSGWTSVCHGFLLNAMIFSTTPDRVSLVLKIYRIVKLIGVQINPETDFIAKHGIPRFDHCQLKRYNQNRRNYAKGSVYQYGQLANTNYALHPAKRTKCGTFLAIFCIRESIIDFHNNSGQISRNHAAG